MRKFLLILFFFSNLNAATIVDHEIETFIKDNLIIISPDTAESTNIHILLSETPNAFISKNNDLYVTTGLIKYIQSPEGLLGVLAHEVGHLEMFHLHKRKETLKEIKLLDQLSSLASITTAILAKRPELLIESKLASQINIQNYYSSFTKDQEREADIYAIEKLNELSISTNGLQYFLKFLKKEFYKKGLSKENLMLSTHPYFDERLNMITSHSNNYYNYTLDEKIKKRFFFITAKLFGHTENDIEFLHTYLTGEYLEYAKSIILANNGKLLESLQILNKFIDQNPNNSYIIETKADLLFNHGYINLSKEFYELALTNNTNNIYIKKKIFSIEYDFLEFNDYDVVNDFFQKHHELIFDYKANKKLINKWAKIFDFLDKKYWLLYIKAKIDLINNNNRNAIPKLKEILDNSNNKKLLYYTKKELKKINNE